jgi:MYXO-CTERM domain-containing protein
MLAARLNGLIYCAFMLGAALLVAPSASAANYALSVDAAAEQGQVVRFWQESVGSDHMYTVIGSAEGTTALSAYQMAAKELGMKAVRGHGILDDDVGIYSEVNGSPVYNFTNYDKIIDAIVGLGMKPIVELSFMPGALASGTATFGWYGGKPGNITPPKSYDHWQALIYNVAKHSIERYGAAQVESWYWEVWNEPDLPGFFTGSQADYLNLYDRAVAGLMQASPNLKVGGPSVAIITDGWIEALIDHCMKGGVKLDFISWHKYPYPDDAHALNIADGNRQVVSIITQKKAQYPALNVLNFLTEWNSSFRGGDSFNNEMGASFVAKAVHAMFQDQSGIAPPDRAAFWVISDDWEEWDSRSGPAFDVMGLVMRKHDVKKPSYLAFQALAMMRDRHLAFSGGTQAEVGLNGFATLSNNGKEVRVLVYDHNYGDGQYANTVADHVTLQLKNLPFQKANAVYERVGVDSMHNSSFRVWDAAGRPVAPTEDLWLQMKAAGQLGAIDARQTVPISSGGLTLDFDQLQPGVSVVTVTEEGATGDDPSGGTGGAAGLGGIGPTGGTGPGSGGTTAQGGSGAGGGAPSSSGASGSSVAGSSAVGSGGGGAGPRATTPLADTSGCGCETTRPRRSGSVPLFFGLAGLLLLARRARRAPSAA